MPAVAWWCLGVTGGGCAVQAGSAGSNSLAVMKLANLTRMRRARGGDDEEDEDEGSSSDEEEGGAGGATAPVLQVGTRAGGQ